MNHNQKHDIRPEQSIELLKELHILTRDGKMNQDSRRKLKQVYHLYQFIEPLLNGLYKTTTTGINLVDHGAGKSYLGFILYDLFFKSKEDSSHIYGIETRSELVTKSITLAASLNFKRMSFLNLSVNESITSNLLPNTIDIVTALHACDTATDDAINFALNKKSQYIILVPCCQAEVASIIKKTKSQNILGEIWRHPIHTREFGSHITNVLRGLLLEANGYDVTITELVGWEHSIKNELIIARYNSHKDHKLISNANNKLEELLATLGLKEGLKNRYNAFLRQDKF